MPIPVPPKGDSLTHSSGARGPKSPTSSRQDGARGPKTRPQQPPKR